MAANEPLATQTLRCTAADGTGLVGLRWEPAQSLATLVIVHGIGEHIGRYARAAATLAIHGLAVEGYDLRGHGRSEGPRVFVDSFDQYLTDLDLTLADAEARHPGMPLFLLGHSMGGTIVALYAIERGSALQGRIRGLIVSSATIFLTDDISPLLQRVSGLLGLVLPHLPTVPLKSAGLSRLPQVVQAYDADPLVFHGGVPARTGAELVRAMKRIQADMEAIQLPLLIRHGSADRLCAVEGSRALAQRASSRDKTYREYDNFYHELHNEPEREAALADLADWLVERC
jgi:alpha-beta hydrolase superfamily lysophospholipase